MTNELTPAWGDRREWLWACVVGVLTAVFYVAAFPPFDTPELAFVFAVPALLWAFRGPSRKLYLVTMYVACFAAWLALIFWLHHVTWVGMILLAAFLALLQAAWFWPVHAWTRRIEERPVVSRIVVLAGLAGFWVLIEWVRTWLFTGFPWLPLAASQWQRPIMLPVAAWTGAAGVSFLLVFFNGALAAYFRRIGIYYRQGLRRLAPEFMVAAALLIFGSFGLTGAQRLTRPEPAFTAAVVQPNVPQDLKWDPEEARRNLEILHRTTMPMRALAPDVVVWPEAVTPWALKGDPGMRLWIERVAREMEVPLLFGAVAVEDSGTPEERWLNGAYLADPVGGLLAEEYAKRKRVPFGEYVPLKPLLGWLRKVTPIGEDLDPGDSARPIHLTVRSTWRRLGILICYEDIFPGLARDSVREGAEFLIVLTNNAWFGEGSAAYQHAAHSVLRAVETRRPVIRCGNAGWTGWIDESGVIRDVLMDRHGSIYFRGATVFELYRDARWTGTLTPYVRWGDWFVGLSALMALAGWWSQSGRFYRSTQPGR